MTAEAVPFLQNLFLKQSASGTTETNQMEKGSLGGAAQDEQDWAGDQRAPKGKRLGSGGRDLKIQRKGEGGCSGPAPIRREVDNRGKRRGFGKEELKKGEAKLQNKNSNLIQERFR